ncbi:16S rRNA (uracil(1498)-N(3))-methyltransferase [Sphingoaurantiacus capsulatus]|uniref:Ribosomal RNA small subunit methyltransferase E n=1 Tax=Sphingoaurantiacus capsulatus TaxID=1771310 RepID=A0ABV7X9Z4_9SPHN
MSDEPLSSSGPRLFVDEALGGGRELKLPTAQSHYLSGVMRLKAGDTVRLFDDRTGEWLATISDAGRKSVTVTIGAQIAPREAVPDLWLCAAPIKRGRIDWVAEKACELGVAKLLPVLTRRTVVDKLNLDRLRAHMIEAAEQCERTALPEMQEPVTLAKLLDSWPADRQLIFCDEEGGVPLASVAKPGAAAILIGPEGGFDPAERERIRALPQAVGVGLGPRVLRADTAAVAAVSLWQAAAGDWR